MRLIKVEAQGFKSFADKVVLTFDGSLIGIVGPNGSGKSNINDAVKWVLGEISAKSLRGNSMEDVIFSGSKTVPAMNKAVVSLTFDNNEGLISLPHKKFTISRILKRGQISEYYINDEIARLKDIREIAMESGIWKSSLAIISQGTVQDIAEATPEQLRLVFEQAAGVSKYKVRKTEALRKLEKTTESLEKIVAVANELEKQLNPLKKQAEKAQIYLTKRQELRKIEISLIVNDMVFFGQKLQTLNLELNNANTLQVNFNEQINHFEQEITTKTQFKLNLDNEVQDLDQKYQQIMEKLSNVNNQENAFHERRKLIIQEQIHVNQSSKIKLLEEELKLVGQNIHNFKINESIQIKNNEAIKEKRNHLSTNINQLQTQINQINHIFLSIDAKINILQDQKNYRSNLFKGVKTILDNKNNFPYLHGIVAELMVVNPRAKLAIEIILNSTLQHLVVERDVDAIKAINFLKSNKSGRASFILLNQIKAKYINHEHLQITSKQLGFIGVAANLVSTKKQYEMLIQYLLGNILVVDTIENGAQIFKIFNNYTIVSLDGNIIRPSGIMTGGSVDKSNHLLSVDQEIEDLQVKKNQLAIEINTLNNQLINLEVVYNDKNNLISEINLELATLKQKIHFEQSHYNFLKNEYEAISQTKFNEPQEYKQDFDYITLEQSRQEIKVLVRSKRETIINLNNQLAQLTVQKNDLDKSLRNLITDYSHMQGEKNKAEYIFNNAQTRLAEEYEMTFERAQSISKVTINSEKARQIVTMIKQTIKDLGHVNLDAIEDYKKINERWLKIKKHRDELFGAQQTILSAINQMDQIIIDRLNQIVQKVNNEIGSIFKVMFGGGSAYLKYTTPHNLLESGIEIEAKPPGKTIKKIKLFSGGEKSLVAISLLFAILKSKPLPLCILDEVEASLDDGNVIRYANYLQELKLKTQFIVITHRLGTMAQMDKLFGATMQKRGVTSFFSVELTQAKDLLTENKELN